MFAEDARALTAKRYTLTFTCARSVQAKFDTFWFSGKCEVKKG